MGPLLAAISTLVFCAPGYPGTAGAAQPLVDQFASAVVAASGWPQGSLAAIYDPSDTGGLAKLASPDAALAFVPYPFFVEHGTSLHLTPLAQAEVAGTGTEERWTLVAKAGHAIGPTSIAGYSLVSVAGYAPHFVRNSALAAWPLPADVKIESTGQTLTALRRIAAGESLLALLDQTEAAALATLPFAKDLQSIVQSAPVPVAIVAVVGARISPDRTHALQAGLLKMGHDPASSSSLGALRLQGFVLPKLPGTKTAP